MQILKKYYYAPEIENKNDLKRRTGIAKIFFWIVLFVFGLCLIYSKGAFGQEISLKEIENLRSTNTQTFYEKSGERIMRVYLDNRFDVTTQFKTELPLPIFEKPIFETIPTKSAFLKIFTIDTAFASTGVVSGSTNNKDSRSYSGSPTDTYGTDVKTWTLWHSEVSQKSRAYVNITLPSAPTASTTITHISLNMKVESVDTAQAAVNVHELTKSDWVENELSWNNYKSGTAWGTAGGDYSATIIDQITPPTAGNWATWYLYGTNADNAMATLSWGGTANLILKLNSESGGSRSGYSYHTKEAISSADRPYIEITYTTPEPTPTPTPTPTPESTTLSTESIPLLQELIRTGNGTNLGLTFLIFFEMLELLIIIYGIKKYVG